MHPYIILLRGINVGGRNKLAMKELVLAVEAIGGTQVTTYIQSGNAVAFFKGANCTQIANDLQARLRDQHGLDVGILVFEQADFEAMSANNPFPEADSEPKTLHLFFMASPPPSPDLGGAQALQAGSERHALDDRVFYLHAPEGVGRSKLASKVERLMGVPTTARNWNTVKQLLDIAQSLRRP